ncbi:MAG: leucine-rich repeat protein [Candidatus Limivivens sp.]|nr:leucine-rich repeat protein [Candidatus Limivivens sp.]
MKEKRKEKEKEKKQWKSVRMLAVILLLAWGLLTGNTAYGESAGKVYPIPAGILQYDAELDPEIEQYASEKQNGVFQLQNQTLMFFNAAAGSWLQVYEFPKSEYSYDSERHWYVNENYWDAFVQGGLLYYMYNNYYNAYGSETTVHVLVYDMEARQLVKDIPVPGHYGEAIGADPSGRIYLFYDDEMPDGTSRSGISVYSSSGQQLASLDYGELYRSWNLGYETSSIYEFNGFLADGTFFYTRMDDYLYWGYDHTMQTLAKGTFSGGKLTLEKDYLFMMCQAPFNQHRGCMQILNNSYAADTNGSIYTLSSLKKNEAESVLYVQREDPEYTEDAYGDYGSIGVRAFCDSSDGSLYSYTMNGNIFVYDLKTKKQQKKYRTGHEVFSLLEMGSQVIAFEKEDSSYFVEVIPKSAFRKIETVKINLNQTDSYKDHTEEAVLKKWMASRIDSSVQVYEKEPSAKAPYRAGTYTEEMQEGLLKYSNYLRWLGGLTPFTWADDETSSNAAKAAVVLDASGQFSHSPEKTDSIADMSDSFFEAGKQGASDSNLSLAYHADASSYMDVMNGFLNDTENVSAFECGHRFTFLQRGGAQIAYGSSGACLAQTIVTPGNQENETGTIHGVDNNDYAYTWPGAGAFPTDVINTRARWSINLNLDKVDLSSEGLQVIIRDLKTGKEYDQTNTLSTSRYMGVSAYANWFYGACIMFDPPSASSYKGKSYLVTLKNLETPEGDPVELIYTVKFLSYEGVHTIDGEKRQIDANGASLPVKGSLHTVKNLTYEITKTSATKGTVSVKKPVKKDLTTVVIPDTVVIDGYSFRVTAIGDGALKGCTGLKKATIGANVTKIGKQAFDGDKALKTIIINSASLKSVGTRAFRNIYKRAVFKVPAKKVTAYTALLKKGGTKTSMQVRAMVVKEYTVTFKNGSKTVKIQKVVSGKSASAPELTKKGYVLTWSQDFSKVTKNLTVKAVWIPQLPKQGKTYSAGQFKYKVTKSDKKNGTAQIVGVTDSTATVLTIPKKVKLGKYEFRITSIGKSAFAKCGKLKKVVIQTSDLQTIGKSIFGKISGKVTVQVPKAREKAYTALLKKAGVSSKCKITAGA